MLKLIVCVSMISLIALGVWIAKAGGLVARETVLALHARAWSTYLLLLGCSHFVDSMYANYSWEHHMASILASFILAACICVVGGIIIYDKIAQMYCSILRDVIKLCNH